MLQIHVNYCDKVGKAAHGSLRNYHFLVIRIEKMPCIGHFFLGMILRDFEKRLAKCQNIASLRIYRCFFGRC